MRKTRWLVVLVATGLGSACVGKAPMESRRVEASPGVYSVAEAHNAKRVVDVIGKREVRCKRRRPVGTNLTRTTCVTAAEQVAYREADQEALKEMQRRNGPVNYGSTMGRLDVGDAVPQPGGGRR